MTNYYSLLEIGRDASLAEIRKQFRYLAFRYHPDHAGHGPESNERFHALMEAYETLSDVERRASYDRELEQKHEFEQQQDLFTDLESSHRSFVGKRKSRRGIRKHNYQAHILEGVFFRSRLGKLDIFEEISVPIENTIKPTRMSIHLSPSHQPIEGKGRYRICTPGELWDGAVLKIEGLGFYQHAPHALGNLYLKVRLEEHETFHIEGTDVYCNAYIFPWEAALGTTLEIASLDGWMPVNVPQGFTGYSQLRFPKRGLYDRHGERGDLWVTIKVNVSPAMTEKTRRLWSQLAREAVAS